ncbi:MAG: UvrD-helicase domain-containing protein [Patulibacter sp.]|nr:UvrD-helicase domain-containing protein [Patulibacter sp.]
MTDDPEQIALPLDLDGAPEPFDAAHGPAPDDDPVASSPVDHELLYTADGALRRELPTTDGGGAVFSPRQAAAIERRGETLVSAGAGAGKTSVLVERYLRLLESDDRLSTGTILAITFTEKAAAEMRERVRIRLSALLGGQTDLPERWRLEDAWIGTFHGIAQRILRRFSFAAGIDPDVTIADEERAAELRLAAFERSVAAWLRDPVAARGGGPADAGAADGLAADADAALALAAAVGINALRDETLGLLALRRTQGRDPSVTARDGGTALPIPPATDEAAERAAAQALHAAAPAAAEEARERFDQGKPTPAGQRALDALHDVVADLGLGDPDVLPTLERLQAWAIPDRRSKPMKGPAVEALRSARERAVACAWARQLGPHGVRDLRLREALLVATARAYRAAKREQATLDFDDLLLALLGLLRRNPEIAARLRGRFRQVLVDEYQDTNPVQLELVERLSAPEGRFQVGDRLQAIYGFRHATVAGFDDAAARAETVGGRLALNETFRCRIDVLAVANRVGVPSHDGFQPLVGGHDRPIQDRRDAPPVEIHVLAEPADDGRPPTDDDRDQPDAAVAPGEPEHVAAVVAELIAAGRRASEIALLVRRKAPVAELERALLDRGIDTVPVVAAPLLETLEVRELEAWLRAVANPHDDVALLGALRLPTAGVDADALVPLLAEHRATRDERSAADGSDLPTLWDTLGRYLEDDYRERYPVSEDARDDLAQQLTVLRKHRAHARRWGPARILGLIRADDGYRASILSRPGGVRRWAGVDAFIDWVEEQEAAGDDLTSLLDRVAGSRGGPEAPVLTDGDAVRITTVHRSKGLEWPVVICCDLGAPVRVVEPGLLVDPDPASDRIGMRVPLPDGDKVGLWAHDELAAAGRRAQAEEERRLIHVAMTRAKERLILCGAWDPETEGTGADKRPTGRLRADRVQPVEPGQGHDLQPRTAPLRWLLPLIAPPDVWPSCGEQTDIDVHDPSGATSRPGRVRIVVCDPAATALPDAMHARSAPELEIVAPPEDEDVVAAAPPRFPLPDPVSYSVLSERLGTAVADDGWRGDPDDDAEASDAVSSAPVDDPLVPPLFTTAALDGRVRGAVVHRLLERRLLDPDAGPATSALVREIVAAETGAADVDDADAAALIAIAASLERTTIARDALARPPEQRHVERPFLLDLDPALPGLPLVHGVIDLWLDHDDEVTIADWKTNALGGASPDAIVARHYTLQRDVYAVAALLGGARLVELAFVFSEAPDRPVRFAFTQADREGLLRQVVDGVVRAQATPPPD